MSQHDYKKELLPEIRRNSDGTYAVEEFGVHHSHATFGDVVAWFVDRLMDLEHKE